MSSCFDLQIFGAMTFVYIIESASTKRWYYGSTSNPIQRVHYHNKGWNRSTNGRGPWKLIFLKEFETAFEARAFELLLKQHKSKVYVLKKHKQHFLT